MRAWFIASALLAVVACGGKSAESKCEDLIDVTCDRAVECVPGAGTVEACVMQLRSVLPCGNADRVSDSYDACMDQLDGLSCAVLFPNDPMTGMPTLMLPADCNMVIIDEG